MDNLDYLFAAFAAVWVAIFGYIFVLSRKQKQLQHELETIQQRMTENMD